MILKKNKVFKEDFMDLVIRNAQLRNYKHLVDIGIKDGIFAKINTHILSPPKEEIDAQGKLVSPPFVESHVHLDSSLTAGDPRENESGTLLEAIGIWGEKKEKLTKEEIKKNAMETIKWEIANGTLRIRSHTDSTEKSLMTLQALLEVKEEMRDFIDIQIVAFPQDGIFSYRGMDD